MRKLKDRTEHVAVKLTVAEQVRRGQELGSTLEDISAENGRHEMLKREMKSAMAALEAKRDRLTLIVTRGEDTREVAVQDMADDVREKVVTMVVETGEIISERPIRPEERQLELSPALDGGA